MLFGLFKKKEKIVVDKVVAPKIEVKKQTSKEDLYKMYAGKSMESVQIDKNKL